MAKTHMKFVNPNAQHFLRNILYASTLGLPNIQAGSKDGSVVIAGSGPSLGKPETLSAIRREIDAGAEVCACKKAVRFLHDQEIPVHMSVSMDPSPRMAYPDKIYRTPQTVYYIASSSAPDLFEYLADNRVVIWHSACGEPDELALYTTLFDEHATCVGGGFNVVNRAIGVCDLLGFQRFVLVGCDGGHREHEDFYIDGMAPTVKKVPMTTSEFGKPWWSAPDMIASSVEIAKIARSYDRVGRGDDFVIVGDTLPAILRQAEESLLNRCARMIPS